MGEHRTIVGRLDERGALPILELSLAEHWTGKVTLKHESAFAHLWIVKGEVAHVELSDPANATGSQALAVAVGWRSGEYILKTGILPPERSVRHSTRQLLDERRTMIAVTPDLSGGSHKTALVGRTLLQILDGLREQVPGLEAIRLMRGSVVEATASNDSDDTLWLDRQLKSFLAEENHEHDAIFVQEGRHSLLVLKNVGFSTILSARTGTAPEALFWAGAEASRRLIEPTENLGTSR